MKKLTQLTLVITMLFAATFIVPAPAQAGQQYIPYSSGRGECVTWGFVDSYTTASTLVRGRPITTWIFDVYDWQYDRQLGFEVYTISGMVVTSDPGYAAALIGAVDTGATAWAYSRECYYSGIRPTRIDIRMPYPEIDWGGGSGGKG